MSINDIDSIDLNDELDDDTNQVKICFQTPTKSYNISLLQLLKFSGFIQKDLNVDDNINRMKAKITEMIESNYIKEENLEIFFDLLEEKKVKISQNNYLDLCKLSEMFEVEVLKKCLTRYSKNHSNDIDFILNILIENEKQDENFEVYSKIENSINIEDFLIDNINECLQKKMFAQLQISTIDRIIKKSDKQQISNDLLYDFISESIETRFSLFSFLQIEKLSDVKFKALYNNFIQFEKNGNDHYFQYLPVELEYIKKLKDEKECLEKQIIQLEQANSQLLNKQKELMENNEKEVKELKEQQVLILKENDIEKNKFINMEVELKKFLHLSINELVKLLKPHNEVIEDFWSSGILNIIL